MECLKNMMKNFILYYFINGYKQFSFSPNSYNTPRQKIEA